MTVLGSRVRACFLVAMDAAILAACREAATPPARPSIDTSAPDAAVASAEPDAGADAAEASPVADQELPEKEWRAKVRPLVTACKKDQIRNRFAVDGGGANPCAPKTVYGVEVVTGAELDPLADNTGKACHYTYCEQIHAKRATRKTCRAPKPERWYSCIVPPEQGSRIPAPAPYQKCPAGIAFSDNGEEGPFDPQSTKLDDEGHCCYAFCSTGPVPGRAFRVDGAAVVAGARDGDAWLAPLDWHPASDLVAASRWLHEAALEHASIAAFARLSLELLAHGAPPSLVTMAHAAALDEIEHARICFAFAHAYGATSQSPRSQPAFTAPRAQTLVELAVETFLDGCIGETTASLSLHAEAIRADDVQRALLVTMAEDEARHAELGWAIVAWAIEQEPAVALAVSAAYERHVATDTLERISLERVVRPCLARLC